MGIALHDAAVHKRAGVALIAVADHIALLFRLPRYLFPFSAGGEASAPAPAQPGSVDHVDHFVRRHLKQCLLERRKAAARQIFIEGFRVKFAAVFQNDARLLRDKRNFIGAFAGVLRDQGVNIVINLFCGPVINAARAIAFQVNVAVNGFATNFMTAINPQITKSYASGDYLYMLTLVQSGARFSFYLLLLLSLPIIIETNTILTLWLKNVPEYTVIFVRLVLVFAMCEVLSGTQITALQATGNIRNYQIVVGSLQLLNFPISYLLLGKGYAPETTMYVAICLSLGCLFARLWFLHRQVEISIKSYFTQVLLNVCVVAVLAAICPIIVSHLMNAGILRLFVVSGVCAIATLIVIYYVGLSVQERIFVQKKIVARIKQKCSA